MRTLVLVLALASLGCRASASEPITCAEPGTNQGVGLAIRDGKSGATNPFYDVLAVATDGAYKDTLTIGAIPTLKDQRVFSLAVGRAGTYAVMVTARGYLPWTKTGVVVKREACKIVPALLTVDLLPSP